MRRLDTIIVHCSYTKPHQNISVHEVRQWHTLPHPRGNGWSDVGYHYIIRRNGAVNIGRDIRKPGAHARGHNATSIGICLVGGMSEDGKPEANYTVAQYETLIHTIKSLKHALGPLNVIGHCDVNTNKECPCFDVNKWYKNIGGD